MDNTRKNLLLTGYPGAGKTTVIMRTLAVLNLDAGGFYTEEIRKGGLRTGFKLITLDGEETVLAEAGFPSKYRVSKYGVNVAGVEEVAVGALERALKTKNLIVIDEIGKMECLSPLFRETALKCLDGPVRTLAAIAKKGDAFIEAIKKRSDVTCIEVTAANRETLPSRLAQIITPGRGTRRP